MTDLPQVVSIEIPRTERRTPFVVVNVAVGPLVLALGVVMLRSGRLSVRRPLSILGEPAVTGLPGVWEGIEDLVLAAIRADPAARRHLSRHRSERVRIEFGAAPSSASTGRPTA